MITLNLNESNTDNLKILYTIKAFLDQRSITSYFLESDLDTAPDNIDAVFKISYTKDGYTDDQFQIILKDKVLPLLYKNVFVIGDPGSGVKDVFDALIMGNSNLNPVMTNFTLSENAYNETLQSYLLNKKFFEDSKDITLDTLKNLLNFENSIINVVDWSCRIDNSIDNIVPNVEKPHFIIVIRDPYSLANNISKRFIEKDVEDENGTITKIIAPILQGMDVTGNYINTLFQRYYDLVNNPSIKTYIIKYEDMEKPEAFDDLISFIKINVVNNIHFQIPSNISVEGVLDTDKKDVLKKVLEEKKDIYSFFGYTI